MERDPAASPFVGREPELGELRAALAAARGGSGRLVLIGGEPGIGKSRLASMVAAEAAASGMPAWSARCWEDGTAPVFWPWNAALRRWSDAVSDETVIAAAGPLAAELSRVFPALRVRIPDLPTPSEWESDQARFRLFDAASRFLATLAAPIGLTIVLDDLQWADGPSLKLLEFVTADLAHARLLIVATYRDTEVRRGDRFFATLASLAREAPTRRLVLPGLSIADCVRYVGLAGVTPAPAALGAELHRETNGNPFFLSEIVQLGRLEAGWDPRQLPPGIREVVARRLDRLGGACRTALTVAALVGERFETGRLADVLASADGVSDVALPDALERAARDRLLRPVEGVPAGYAFAHALIRRVLIDEIEPAERIAWHTRIARVLERGTETQKAAAAGELVHHCLQVGTRDALRKAATYAQLGATHAARELGWEEAARLYEVALDAGARSAALDEVQRIELGLALAGALRHSGDVVGARRHCREAAAACRATGRHDLLGRVALVHAGPVPDFYRVDPEARTVLEEACRGAEACDDALRARLLARLASDIIAANEIDQMDRALVLGDDAAAAARRAGDDGALGRALFAGFYLAALGTRPRTSGAAVVMPPTLPSLAELLATAESSGDHEFAAEIRHTRTVAMFALGEADAYQAEHDALTLVAATSRVPEALWLADALAAMRATVEGRFAEGQRLSDRALATGLRMQLANATGVHLGQQISWYAAQGRLAELAPTLHDFVERHPGVVVWRAFHAVARLAAGDVASARAEFRSLVAAGFRPAKRGVNLRSYLAGLAALCIGLREREHAPELYELVARRPEPWCVDGCMTFGPWALALGSLARLAGRPADAAAHFEHAIDLGRRMHARPVVTQAETLLAGVWLAHDADASTRARAMTLLAEAEPEARELRLVDALARIEHLRAKLRRESATAVNVIRCDGDFWTVCYDGTKLQVKDGRGLHYLAALLAAPGRELHVLQLATLGRTASVTADVLGELQIGILGGSLDDAPDARARGEYRARLVDVRHGLEEAERFGDLGRLERLRAERDRILAELAGRFGSHARARGPAETARKAVTKALRTQIGKLLTTHPALGRHLRDAVRMGTVCVYTPSLPMQWRT